MSNIKWPGGTIFQISALLLAQQNTIRAVNNPKLCSNVKYIPRIADQDYLCIY